MIDPARWGVEPGYHDVMGNWRDADPSVIKTILSTMGAGPDDDPFAATPIVTVRLDHPLPPVPPGTLTLEDGAALACDGRLPADLPPGYHTLAPDGGEAAVPLVASPGACPEVGGRRWGWAAQLYAARSRASWGMGDLADLRRLGEWSGGQGAGLTLLNPLHAAPPIAHQQPSPYFASSRCFVNPLYLAVEELPGAGAVAGVAALAAAGAELNSSRLIDRDRVWALKSEALEAIFAAFGGDPDYERFCAERGDALESYAAFCALAEIHGLPWQAWPAELRRPDSPAVRRFASGEGRTRVRYHQWLQWHLDRQLRAASAPVPLVADLAIGVDAGGADAWIWQDCFSFGARVGAPPDEFNTLGQDWGLPPWDPWRLRAAAYRPYIETLRAGLRHAGGLRFDHVMGLFRLYWIPEGRSPAEGTYVRYPHWDLLNILALEASRAGAFVVGEDLGTVEDLVREELSGRRVLSYRLLWFEPERPPTWPRQALGAVTTHDLPTVAGVWSGADLDAQRRLDLSPNEESSLALRRKLEEWTGVGADAPVEEVVEGSYRALAGAPCDVLTATLDDALAVEERPNMPGTVTGWPNWCLALPVPLEDLTGSPLAERVAAHLRAGCEDTGAGTG